MKNGTDLSNDIHLNSSAHISVRIEFLGSHGLDIVCPLNTKIEIFDKIVKEEYKLKYQHDILEETLEYYYNGNRILNNTLYNNAINSGDEILCIVDPYYRISVHPIQGDLLDKNSNKVITIMQTETISKLKNNIREIYKIDTSQALILYNENGKELQDEKIIRNILNNNTSVDFWKVIPGSDWI